VSSAALWLQTQRVERSYADWGKLYAAVFEQFDKDQYQLQLRQLYALKQTRSVADYQQRFKQLAHGILLYKSNYDDVYFVTRFLGGLKEEIICARSLPYIGPNTGYN